MNIAKEILLNQLIRIRYVRRRAEQRHITGLNADSEGVDRVYDLYFRDLDIRGKRVLELGPGHTFQVMKKAKENGASEVTIIDIEKYIADDEVREHGIEYVIYDGGRMPFEQNHFDVVCSHTVFEHLRNPAVTVSEVYRVTKPGSVGVHLIDLQDHFFTTGDNPDIFNCMRYSNAVWKAMTYNRSTWVNRLRYSEWVDLFEKAGFTLENVERSTSPCIKELYDRGQIAYLRHMDEADATTKWVTIHSSKP
jgi:ubiquinone/menaquinone biosynthesis C-methylase UbiE